MKCRTGKVFEVYPFVCTDCGGTGFEIHTDDEIKFLHLSCPVNPVGQEAVDEAKKFIRR